MLGSVRLAGHRQILARGAWRVSWRLKSSQAKSLVDCSKTLTQYDVYGGVGAFARRPIKKGEVVEIGVACRLAVDGDKCAFVHSWSEDHSVWAHGSGASMFYNASLDGGENSEMDRFYDEDRFVIRAIRDIAQGEEVTHMYKSIQWRACFAELKAMKAKLDAAGEGIAKTPLPRIDVTKPSLTDSSRVYVDKNAQGSPACFAAVAFKTGDLVERGIVRRIPADGNLTRHVFSWSDDHKVWATGSGCSAFYNAAVEGKENVQVLRYFEDDRFEVYATRDIALDEELTDDYAGHSWRECYQQDFNAGGEAASSEREAMKSYWGGDHGAPTLENMMLSSDASVMDALERPEILSELPSLSGKKVLELGAGIGRFSGPLALKAKEVVAVDFVASSSEENRRANAHHRNLTVLTADATTLEQPEEAFDLVFSNWLLMYLTDDELKTFAMNALRWLQPGGHLFFRESCFHASGNTAAARRFNPTKYRDPETYSQVFSEMRLDDGSRFQLLATNCVDSYADMKDNVNQMWFRWVKVDGGHGSGRFMNPATGQYSTMSSLRYEKIYGRDYVCTGGQEISKQIGAKCAETLKPGARVLDVGCALGGTMLHLAEEYPDVYFHGVTGSGELAAMFAGRHVRRPTDIRKRVSHEVATEVADLRYQPNSFDVVIMRESLMYVKPQDKAVLLRMISRMLRPGGQLVIIDYASGGGQGTGDLLGRPTPEAIAEFGQHVKKSDYSLMEAARTAELLGRYFTITEQSDRTDDFIQYMDQGLASIEASFGPQAPARRTAEEASASSEQHLAALREEIAKKVTALFPKGAAETAAHDAADAAMETVSLQLAAIDAEAQRCVSDHDWMARKWAMKRSAAEAGALRWVFFVATKADTAA